MTKEVRLPGSDHPITIEPAPSRIVVRAGKSVVAETARALVLHEATYPGVFYIPLADIDLTLLRHTNTSTYCPYKGDCSYYTVPMPEGDLVDAAWTYHDPYPAVTSIVDHVAFYPDRVEIATE